MPIAEDFYLIVDLEATCSDQGEVPRHEMEIIEIGAVILRSATFEFESEFQTFVRPVRHPELTDFCKKLTHIAQSDVSAAPGFIEAFSALQSWMSTYQRTLFCSWGDYDKDQIKQDCNFHKIEFPFDNHLNLKAEFSRALGLRKKMGINGALGYLGLNFEGSPHRGIDDARNIARIARRLFKGT